MGFPKENEELFFIRTTNEHGKIRKGRLFKLAREEGFDTSDPVFHTILLSLDERGLLDVGLIYVKSIPSNERRIQISDQVLQKSAAEIAIECTSKVRTTDDPIYSWNSIYAMGDAIAQLRAAIKVLPDGLPYGAEIQKVLSGLEDTHILESKRTWEHEMRDACWVVVEEGPGKGYMVCAIPISDDDSIGDKADTHKGIVQHPTRTDLRVQTTASSVDWALEAAIEIAGIQVDEGIFPEIGEMNDG